MTDTLTRIFAVETRQPGGRWMLHARCSCRQSATVYVQMLIARYGCDGVRVRALQPPLVRDVEDEEPAPAHADAVDAALLCALKNGKACTGAVAKALNNGGSPAYRRAASYALRRLREAGMLAPAAHLFPGAFVLTPEGAIAATRLAEAQQAALRS